MSGFTAGAIVVVGLLLLVLFHELGHFVAARLVGIRATKFYVGFPPAIAKFKRGETEYGVGAVLLGGYVKLPGMFEPEPSDVHWRLEPLIDEVIPGVQSPELRLQLSAALRALGTASTPGMLSKRAVEAMEVVKAIRDDQTDTVGPYADQPLTAYTNKLDRLDARLETIVDDAHPQAYWRAALWRRMVVIAAGPLVNVVLAILILWVALIWFIPSADPYDVMVADVAPGLPAADAGVKPGDRILSWDGRQITSIDRYVDIAKTTRNQTEIEIAVARDGKRYVYDLPTQKSGDRRLVGITAGPRFTGYVGKPPGEALVLAGQQTYEGAKASLIGLARVATVEGREELGTVVGVVGFAGEAARARQLITMIAFISLVLAVFNLLPLLPLDGGHLAFGLIEFLRRGRPAARETFERFSLAGLTLILLLFVVGLRNDIARF